MALGWEVGILGVGNNIEGNLHFEPIPMRMDEPV
jgi:hypothetical protein